MPPNLMWFNRASPILREALFFLEPFCSKELPLNEYPFQLTFIYFGSYEVKHFPKFKIHEPLSFHTKCLSIADKQFVGTESLDTGKRTKIFPAVFILEISSS